MVLPGTRNRDLGTNSMLHNKLCYRLMGPFLKRFGRGGEKKRTHRRTVSVAVLKDVETLKSVETVVLVTC